MSGFLAAYAMCAFCEKHGTPGLLAGKWKMLDIKKNVMCWLPMVYLHRYIRLTPLYAFVLLLYMRVLDARLPPPRPADPQCTPACLA